jgi:hypothetical protein
MQFNTEIADKQAYRYGYDCDKVPSLIVGSMQEGLNSVCILPPNYTVDDLRACLKAMEVVKQISDGEITSSYGYTTIITKRFMTSWDSVCGFFNVPNEMLNQL